MTERRSAADGSAAPGNRARQRVRLDRWLWAARLFRTRAQAKAAIEGGKVHLKTGALPVQPMAGRDSSGARLKPKVSKEIAVGDVLEVRTGWGTRTVEVTGLSEQRGNATAAAHLYRETAASIEAREAERARRRMENAGLRVPQKRPTKRDRRELAKLKQEGGES